MGRLATVRSVAVVWLGKSPIVGQLSTHTFAGVIFDMDGTLIDSTPAVVRSWTTWALEYGVSEELLAGYHGVPSAGVVRAVLPREQWVEAMARINELELSDVHDIVTLPGAAESLAAIPPQLAAIATSCTRPLAEARIAASRLQRPSVLVTVDDVERGKPAPDPFLEAARRLGVDPANCLVVEDAPKGLEAARAAGCHTLAVVTTSTRAELDGMADAIVPDLAAVAWQIDTTGVRVR